MTPKVVRLKKGMIKICEILMHMYQKTPPVLVHSIAQEWEKGGESRRGMKTQ